MNQNIIGIDPGPEKSAYVFLQNGRIKAFKIVENQALYHMLSHAKFKFQLWVEEIQCYGMPVGRDVLNTCKFTGALEAIAWDELDIEYCPVGRRDVKWLLCNSAKAKDSNVNMVMRDIWGEKGTKKNRGGTYGFESHTYAALAVATFGMRQNETK